MNARFWTKIKGLYHTPSRHLTMPTIFVLHCSGLIGPITFLPSFYRPGEALQVCREAVASISKFPNYFYRKCDSLSVDLLGISEENISLAIEMVGAIGVCLQDEPCPILTIIIHENFVQVSSQLFQYILTFILQ